MWGRLSQGQTSQRRPAVLAGVWSLAWDMVMQGRHSLLIGRACARGRPGRTGIETREDQAIYKLGRSMPSDIASGRVLQDAWNLLCFSVLAILAAVTLNWRNDARGWWVNPAVVSIADLGFIFFVLVPGHVPLGPGLVGPIFWIVGLLLTSLALHQKS